MTSDFTGCSLNKSSNEELACPVRGDYRLFTDWRPRCAVQYPMDFNNEGNQKPPTANQYREYLIHNAEKIIQANAMAAKSKARCGPPCDSDNVFPSWQEGTALKEYDQQVCDTRTCSFDRSVPMGLGRGGRGGSGEATIFEPSLPACCGSPFDLLQSGPDQSLAKKQGQDFTRSTVPSGGKPNI
jgi:hypothetical protein